MTNKCEFIKKLCVNNTVKRKTFYTPTTTFP